MALSHEDTGLLTSVYGVGTKEAEHFVTVLNNILAGSAAGDTYMFTRALNQLIAENVIGYNEGWIIRRAIDAYTIGEPDTSAQARLVELFSSKFRYFLTRVEAEALAAAFVGDIIAAPVKTGIAVNAAGTKVTITYNKALDGSPSLGMSVKVGGVAKTITSSAIVGSTVEHTMAAVIYDTDTVTASFDATVGTLHGLGGFAASFTNAAVTNNSTVTVPGGAVYPWDAGAEMIDLGLDSALAMSNADQTGTYTFGAGGTNETGGAGPAGISTAAGAVISTSGRVVGVEIIYNNNLVVEPANGTVVIANQQVTSLSRAFDTLFDSLVEVLEDGTAKFKVQGAVIATFSNATMPQRCGIYFDHAGSRVGFTFGGVDYGYLVTGVTFPAEGPMLIAQIAHTAAQTVTNTGKTASVTLVTDAASMTEPFPVGAVDLADTVI